MNVEASPPSKPRNEHLKRLSASSWDRLILSTRDPVPAYSATVSNMPSLALVVAALVVFAGNVIGYAFTEPSVDALDYS